MLNTSNKSTEDNILISRYMGQSLPQKPFLLLFKKIKQSNISIKYTYLKEAYKCTFEPLFQGSAGGMEPMYCSNVSFISLLASAYKICLKQQVVQQNWQKNWKQGAYVYLVEVLRTCCFKKMTNIFFFCHRYNCKIHLPCKIIKLYIETITKGGGAMWG